MLSQPVGSKSRKARSVQPQSVEATAFQSPSLRLPRQSRWLEVASAALLLLATSGLPLLAEPAGIPLECRLKNGPWRPCTMLIEQVGLHWWLIVDDLRYEFEHDGKGTMRLRDGGNWRTVDSHWAEDMSLCWNGICARGEIPLD